MKRIINPTQFKPISIDNPKLVVAQLSYIELNYIDTCLQLNDLYSKPSALSSHINDLKSQLTNFENRYPIIEKEILQPIPKELNTITFPINLTTMDRIVEYNFKSLLYLKLTIESLKGQPNVCSYPYNHFKQTRDEVKSIYDISYKLKLTEFFSSFCDKMVPYLSNESGQFRSYVMIQMVGAVQKLNENDIQAHIKTEPGPGDMYVYEDGSYVLLDLKSADLSKFELKKLLLKTINKYSKFNKSYICLNGEEDQIKSFIMEEKIKIPSNIKLIFINTQETFTNEGFYGFDSIKKLLLEKLYFQLSSVSFKQEFNKIITKNMDASKQEINLVSLERDLDEFYSFHHFIDCQNLGDNFFDNEVSSDFHKFKSEETPPEDF